MEGKWRRAGFEVHCASGGTLQSWGHTSGGAGEAAGGTGSMGSAIWGQPTSQRPPSCVLLVDETDYIHPENHHTSELPDHRCMFGRIEQGWRQ